jgi:hypothetical protein
MVDIDSNFTLKKSSRSNSELLDLLSSKIADLRKNIEIITQSKQKSNSNEAGIFTQHQQQHGSTQHDPNHQEMID